MGGPVGDVCQPGETDVVGIRLSLCGWEDRLRGIRHLFSLEIPPGARDDDARSDALHFGRGEKRLRSDESVNEESKFAKAPDACLSHVSVAAWPCLGLGVS